MAHAASSIIESPLPPVDVPATTVSRHIRELARRRPADVALVDAASGRSITYGDLDLQIGRFAAGLAAIGFKPGDRLLMLAPNLPEWAVAGLGALAAGGVISGANPLNHVEDLAWQIRDVGARFVFTVAPLRSAAREAAAAAGGARLIVLGDPAGAADDEIAYPSLLAAAGTRDDPPPVVAEDPDALAAVPYSSGTTGRQKGVMLTHRTILANVVQYLAQTKEPDDEGHTVCLAFLPMFHIFGFTVILLAGLVDGSKIVTLPRFEPEPFLKAIQDYRVTHLGVVPPILQFMARHPLVAGFDLSSLKAVGCGAAPLGSALELQAQERLRCRVVQGFGMTESSGVVAATVPGRERHGASGQLLPGTQARVVDPGTLQDVARGESGEIWFRGPQAFKGYLNQPEATAATITRDGWVRTGDIGHVDDDGYLYLTDRLKELIKVKGYQVAPAELEALLFTHPDVADAAVIGRADERAGEVAVAYLVPRQRIDPEGIKAWVAQRVSEYKQLADVVVCDAIPKTPSGKILRRVLRAQDAQRIAG